MPLSLSNIESGSKLSVISVFNRYLNRGGEEVVFDLEVKLLKQHGCSVRRLETPIEIPNGFINSIHSGLSAIWSRTWYKRLLRLLEAYRPDVIHIHNTWPTLSPSVIHAARRFSIPVVMVA